MPPVDRLYDVYIFDLDGTVYLGEALLPKAGETITALRELGKRTLFLSNNPTRSAKAYAARLTGLGLPTPASGVINSTDVLVALLQRELPGATLFVAGETPLKRALLAAGFGLSEEARQVDAVIASFDRTFDYHKLQIAFDAISGGARFFATNADRYCPVPGGGQPDAAAIIAAIEACTGKQVEAVAGKPSPLMAKAVLHLAAAAPADCLMTGDRLETDVLMALNAGMASALTLTGATSRAELEASEIQPAYVIESLGELLP